MDTQFAHNSIVLFKEIDEGMKRITIRLMDKVEFNDRSV
jgi:hypothetical protein